MSRTIDERVVEMRFDNKQFEQNVQTSISSIEKLEKSLNLKGASKGLEDVNVAAKNCNMTPLSNAVETVKMRFSALEVMAMTALSNITNSALNAGTLADGTVIDNLKLNGNNFISPVEIDETIFDGNCLNVTINDGEKDDVHTNMELVQITKMGEEYWFILRDVPENELAFIKLQSDIEYIAMMSEIEL